LDLLDLKKQGMGVREVARATGYSRNTVRKWLRRMESGNGPTPPVSSGRSPPKGLPVR
jgi:transposase